MDSQDALLLVQKIQNLPPHLIRPVKEEICGNWAEIFPAISDYCAYTETIKEKQSSFLRNTIDNIVRGNEVITKFERF